jgi:hypothetical protein
MATDHTCVMINKVCQLREAETMSQTHRQRMSLKYPNARLFVHGLLSCSRSTVPEAIARSACEFGLVETESVDELIPAPDVGPCPCMATARNVVAKYCDNRKKQIGESKLNAEDVWSALEENAKIYFCEGKVQTNNSSVSGHECHKFAPALFDLLLQEIGRYP